MEKKKEMSVAKLEHLHTVLYGNYRPDGEAGHVQILKMVTVIQGSTP